jgi:hypothetical protein
MEMPEKSGKKNVICKVGGRFWVACCTHIIILYNVIL